MAALPHRRVHLVPTLSLLVATLASTAPLAAQQHAVFRGQVFDSTGAPLQNVEVTLHEAQRVARTNASGVFAFHDVAPAFYHVRLRQPGYRAIAGTARISAGDSIELRFRMRRVDVQLDTVRVSQIAPGDPLADFKRRLAYGTGTFITSERLDELKDWHFSSVVRAEAGRVQIAPLSTGGWTVASQEPASCIGRSCGSAPVCYLAVWLDGIRIYAPGVGEPPDLSAFRTEDLVGVEVYPGAAETPLELNATGSSCGTIALWTRMGKRGTGRR